jgi:AcrR family transcriptional regulator
MPVATSESPVQGRARLSRDRVLRVAVDLADRVGADALTMRRLAEQLGVVPMALYKHVANREELLDGMVDVIVREIEDELPRAGAPGASDADVDWRTSVRRRVLAARRTFQRHPWSRRVIESRTTKTSAVLDYIEQFSGLLLAGGLSADLTHHVMHAIGGRMWGFTQELFDDSAGSASTATHAGHPAVSSDAQAAMLRAAAARYPNIVAVATFRDHDPGSIVGRGCDDDAEFEFALDLLLDGVERLHRIGWTSAAHAAPPSTLQS